MKKKKLVVFLSILLIFVLTSNVFAYSQKILLKTLELSKKICTEKQWNFICNTQGIGVFSSYLEHRPIQIYFEEKYDKLISGGYYEVDAITDKYDIYLKGKEFISPTESLVIMAETCIKAIEACKKIEFDSGCEDAGLVFWIRDDFSYNDKIFGIYVPNEVIYKIKNGEIDDKEINKDFMKEVNPLYLRYDMWYYTHEDFPFKQ